MLSVLLGAVLHASWNALVKSSPDKFLDTILISMGAALLCLPLLPFLPQPATASLPYLFTSSCIHVGYFTLVAAAYKAGDMSLAYPLMRGTAPMIVAMASGPLIGEHLGLAAWTGVCLICFGVIVLASSGWRKGGRPSGRAVLLALLNALVIATYTFVDGVGARLSGNAFAYTVWLFVVLAIWLVIWAHLLRPAPVVRAHVLSRWKLGLAGGFCTFGSYVLALMAMVHAPVATVSALRETSILFGVAIAALILKEKVGVQRLGAAVLVVCGAAALKFA